MQLSDAETPPVAAALLLSVPPVEDEVALPGELEPPRGVPLLLELVPPLLEVLPPFAFELANTLEPPIVTFELFEPPLVVEAPLELVVPPAASMASLELRFVSLLVPPDLD